MSDSSKGVSPYISSILSAERYATGEVKELLFKFSMSEELTRDMIMALGLIRREDVDPDLREVVRLLDLTDRALRHWDFMETVGVPQPCARRREAESTTDEEGV